MSPFAIETIFFWCEMQEAELECNGQLQTRFHGKMGCCYRSVALQHTPLKILGYTGYHNIMVAKVQQWLLDEYLENALLLC